MSTDPRHRNCVVEAIHWTAHKFFPKSKAKRYSKNAIVKLLQWDEDETEPGALGGGMDAAVQSVFGLYKVSVLETYDRFFTVLCYPALIAVTFPSHEANPTYTHAWAMVGNEIHNFHSDGRILDAITARNNDLKEVMDLHKKLKSPATVYLINRLEK